MSDIRRTYFTMPGTFDPLNPTKWAHVVQSIKINWAETLTPIYYQDIDPDGDDNVDYAKCYELPNGTQTCSADTPVNTYNPFLGIPLVWTDVDGYERGKVLDTIGSVDYGLGILEFGAPTVNAYYADGYPLITNIQQASGSFFIDIDYDNGFSFEIKVYKNQVYVFSYIATYEKINATTSYSRVFEGTSVPIDKFGFLSGIESNPYITPPLPTPDACAYAIRTLGFALPIILPATEPYDCGEACKPLYVFGSTLDSSRDFNDFTSDFYYRNLEDDTIIFILKNLDNSNQVALVGSTPYGEFWGFGDMAQPDLTAVVVEWREVLLDAAGPFFGAGNYQINKVIQTAGQDIEIEGTIFALKEYTPEYADRTIRITTVQNGSLVHMGVSFKGVQFPSSIRVPGYFGERDPEYTQDNVVYGDYVNRQISMSQKNKYVFKTEVIKDCVFKEIMDFMLFANEIYITDYNIKNHAVYKSVSVELEENEGTDYLMNQGMIINLMFTDRVKNRFKANYGLTQIAGSKFLEGSIGTPPVPPVLEDDIVVLKGFFTIAGDPDMPPILIDNDTHGTYTSLLFDGASGTVQLEVDDIPVSVPFTVTPGQKLDATRTVDDTTGWYKIST